MDSTDRAAAHGILGILKDILRHIICYCCHAAVVSYKKYRRANSSTCSAANTGVIYFVLHNHSS